MKVIGGYSADSEFFKMDYTEFHNWSTGQLIIAIGEGKFKQEVFTIISLAHARGMKRQQELDKEAKKSK